MIDFSSMAVDPVFDTFGVAAVYTNAAKTETTSVKVIKKQPDDIGGALGGSVLSATSIFEVRSRELAAPEKGGTITLGTDVYIIQAPPHYIDDLQHVWLLNTYPEGS